MVVSIMWDLLEGQAGWLDDVLHGAAASPSRQAFVQRPAPRAVVVRACGLRRADHGRPYDVPVIT
jgi:hypothetical protein